MNVRIKNFLIFNINEKLLVKIQMLSDLKKKITKMENYRVFFKNVLEIIGSVEKFCMKIQSYRVQEKLI